MNLKINKHLFTPRSYCFRIIVPIVIGFEGANRHFISLFVTVSFLNFITIFTVGSISYTVLLLHFLTSCSHPQDRFFLVLASLLSSAAFTETREGSQLPFPHCYRIHQVSL